MSNMGRLAMCREEMNEISEFKRAQIYCFLETFISVKVSDKQKIEKIMRSVLTETLIERILDVFLNFLEEHNSEVYDTLKKPGGGFNIDEIFSLITNSVHIENDETKKCSLSYRASFKALCQRDYCIALNSITDSITRSATTSSHSGG